MLFFFDNYTLDTDRSELRRGTDRVAVEPQVFDLLRYLLEHRDRIVSRDDLIVAVWKRRAISDSALDSRINFAFHRLEQYLHPRRFLKEWIPVEVRRFEIYRAVDTDVVVDHG